MGGRLKLGQILVNRGLLHPDQLAAALADQQATGARLGSTLVRMGFVDEETLIRTLAGQLKLPVARIRGKRVGPDVLACIPVDLAERHRCLPLFFKKEGSERVLFVAMEDPSDVEALAELAGASGERLRPVLVGPTELEEALQRHYHWASLTGEAPEWLAPRAPAEAEARSSQADPDPEAPGGPPDAAHDPAPEPDAPSLASGSLRASLAAPEPTWEEGLGWDDEAALRLADSEGDLELELDFEVDAPSRAPQSDLEVAAEPSFEPAAGEGAEAPVPPPDRSAGPPLRPESLDPRIILRALSQLLVEKGVITRDEFVQRLGEIAAQEGAERSA